MRATCLTTGLAVAVLAGLLAAPAAGALVHRYTFENGADDDVGGLDGTASGVTYASVGSPPGGQSALFTAGQDDAIDFAASAFNATGFTVAMWIRTDTSTGTIESLVSNKTGGNADGFALNVNTFDTSDGKLWTETANAAGTGDPAYSDAGYVRYDGTWQHVAYAVDRASGLAQLYYDGADVTGTDDDILTDFNVAGPWRMGLFMDDLYGFDGYIDDVQIYDEVLSAGDVAFLASNPGAAIPEPVTLAGTMLAAGSLLGYVRRRRTRGRCKGKPSGRPTCGRLVSGLAKASGHGEEG